MAEWYERLGKGLARAGVDAATGISTGGTIGSLGGPAGTFFGGIGGGIAGLGYGIYDAVTGDQRDEAAQQAQAAQQQQSQYQGLAAATDAQAYQKRLSDNAEAIHNRANPYAGDAWHSAYNQQAQGLAGSYANQEARGLAQAGASGGQNGATTLAAIRAAHGNALSALQANTQQSYFNQGNQWQQANDSAYQNALGGLYSNAAGMDNTAYQRQQDALHRQDASNAAWGQGAGNILGAAGSFLGSSTGHDLLQGAGLFGGGQPQGVTVGLATPTDYGTGGGTIVQPQKDRSPYAMKQSRYGGGLGG